MRRNLAVLRHYRYLFVAGHTLTSNCLCKCPPHNALSLFPWDIDLLRLNINAHTDDVCGIEADDLRVRVCQLFHFLLLSKALWEWDLVTV